MLATLRKYAQLLRISHWLKNLLLLFPPFFGGRLVDHSVISRIIPALMSFSFAASVSYIVNDILDRDADQNHESKRQRPLACGEIRVGLALTIALLLYISSMLLAFAVSEHFLGYVVIYLLITSAYSIFFKHMVIIDIFAISSGYLLRVLAGGVAFHTAVSKWLFLTVFVVALFLATGKRVAEFVTMGGEAAKHRHILGEYSLSFLEGMLWFSASASLVSYALYVIEKDDLMLYTVPVAAFGLLRYVYIVKQGRGDPTDVLLRDQHIMITGIVWAAMIGIIIYR